MSNDVLSDPSTALAEPDEVIAGRSGRVGATTIGPITRTDGWATGWGPPPTVRPPTPPADAPRTARPGWPVLAATVVLSVAGGAVAGRLSASTADDAGAATTAVPTAVASVDAAVDGGLDVGAVIESVSSSVVSIETTIETRRGPFVQEGNGAGTGVVWTADGLILTNAHVVADATSVTVTLDGDDVARTADVLAIDESNDVAVLRVTDANGLVPAVLADADSVAVGDPVIAIGNALALDGSMTVTSGIVSAVDRSIDTGTGTLTGLIQTDAAISSGNSGGPLVDAGGRVIGINSAVATSYGGVQASNIGFAISIDRAVEIAQALLA